MFDVVVIGGGIMGASAARYIAEAGVSVAVVAPREPSIDDAEPGPFGAHYDVTRLAWIHHADDIETELTRRSMAAISSIEEFSDGPIYSRSGHLFIAETGLEQDKVAAAEAAAKDGSVELMSAEATAQRFSGLAIPESAKVLWEPPPSGYFNPRELVAAQLRAAVRSGAEQFLIAAVGIANGAVTLRDGRRLTGRKVLIANGAYVNAPGLLPRPVALRLKTETVLMAQLGPAEAERMRAVPPIRYALHDPAVNDVYTAPPLRYPDGTTLMKWGANTVMDQWVETPEIIDAWYRSGADAGAIDLMAPSMLATYPGLDVERFHTMRCVVAYTGHGFPYIDAIDPGRLYIAAGGNGHSAKWSAALGKLAASLVLNDEWSDPLPQEKFRVQWAGEVDSWTGKDLLSVRRSRG